MDNDKKQVIPRSQYRRKRREFFHNEEREERIRREREAREKKVEKAQQQSKMNEERVKDNLRKARIEKLTQEEIQQQHELAQERQNGENQELQVSRLEQSETNKTKDGLNLSEDQRNNKEHSQIAQNKDNRDNKVPYSITNHHQALDNKDDKLSKDEGNQPQSSKADVVDNKEITRDKNEIHKDSATRNEPEKNHKTAEKSKHENKKPYSPINNQSTEPKNQNIEKDNNHSSQETSHNQHHENKGDHFDHIINVITSFFKKHWPKLLIIIGIILLLLILNAIFTTVNKNDHTNDSAFNGANKNYTTTMKNANNTVKSVVTVQNDLSNNTTVPKSKSGSDNEIGSGVVYKKVGDSIYILTNAHVVGDKEKQKVTYSNNKSVEGKVIGKDKWSDIAVVKAKISDESIKTITMGDSNNLVLGESILVVGNPLGVDFKGSVSKGIISGLDRHVPVDIDKNGSYDVLMKAFQIDAPVNPGNSGGAVVDKDGRLIGIVSLKIDMENVEGMAFAIPINDVRKIAQQLEDKGKVKYPNTGIKIKNVADMDESERNSSNLPSNVNNGVLIGDVEKNGLGEKSGLKKDDVIVELDGKTVEDNLRYRQIIFSHKDDLKTLTAKIYRNGSEKNIKIKLK